MEKMVKNQKDQRRAGWMLVQHFRLVNRYFPANAAAPPNVFITNVLLFPLRHLLSDLWGPETGVRALRYHRDELQDRLEENQERK